MTVFKFKKIKVTVRVENHVHAGQQCEIGDEIEVYEDTAEWLLKMKVIEPWKKVPRKTPETEDEPSSDK